MDSNMVLDIKFFSSSSSPSSSSLQPFHKTFTLVIAGDKAFFSNETTLGRKSSFKVEKREMPLPALATPLTKCLDAELPRPRVKTLLILL